MRREITVLGVLAVTVLGRPALAVEVILQCDVGCAVVQPGWIALERCGSFANVGGTDIDVTLATGNSSACACRDPGGIGPLQAVEADLLFADDEVGSPGGDFILTLGNLTPGASYRLLSYHNRSDEGLSHIQRVQVTGATRVTSPARIAQSHAIMDSPAEVLFTAGPGDVSIRYIAPTEGEAGRGAQAFLNGFVLEAGSATVSFESESSGGAEGISPARIPVHITNADGENVLAFSAHNTDLSSSDLSFIPELTAYVRDGAGESFRRGDADSSGVVEITDAITILHWLFLRGPAPACMDAADADDSGGLNITDAVVLLRALFQGEEDRIPPPGLDCGPDPTVDPLGNCSTPGC